MHPAFSIIFFTAASGIGYGMLAVAGVLAALGLIPASPSLALFATGSALALASAGLLASLWHLGRPERAWRALSQWRTSWLSREGIAALLTFGPALVFGALWATSRDPGPALRIAGAVLVLCSLATVGCTAMIYASLKPIHEWHNRWVLPNYLSLSIMTGGLWLGALMHLFGEGRAVLDAFGVVLVLVAFSLKETYWRSTERAPPRSTIETATGLGRYGRVRAFEPPHTEQNYLLREMGFRIGRKHAERLRMIARNGGFLLPLCLLLLSFALPGGAATAATVLSAISATLGVFVERWLFFAEAKHTVTLYYGREDAAGGGVRRAG